MKGYVWGSQSAAQGGWAHSSEGVCVAVSQQQHKGGGRFMYGQQSGMCGSQSAAQGGWKVYVWTAVSSEGVCWVTGAHEAQERSQAPLQTNLISYSSHADAPKEWFYYPDAAQTPASPTAGAAAHAFPRHADLRAYYPVTTHRACHACLQLFAFEEGGGEGGQVSCIRVNSVLSVLNTNM